MEYLTIPPEHAGLALDEYLCLRHPGLGKGYWRRAVRAGRVKLDGMATHPSERLRVSQVILLEIDEADLDRPEPPPRAPELRVLYEDEALLALDKPPGLSVEPERWSGDRDTVGRAFGAQERVRPAAGGDPGQPRAPEAPSARPRFVHRLDKETSGVLLAAKDLATERVLRQAFEHGQVEKRYLALVEGEHPLAEGASEEIDLPIGPDPRQGGRMRVDRREGAAARTRVSVEQRFRGYTLLGCRPLTGRTHQIRVHLAETGFPLAVDRYYGRQNALLLSELKRGYRKKSGSPERPLLARLSLHALELRFQHRGLELAIRAELPADFSRALKQLAKYRPFGP